MSSFYHLWCMCIHVNVCACKGMGSLCELLCTICHNISWSISITENTFPSRFTVFDGSASSGVTLQCHLKGWEGHLLLTVLYQRTCMKQGKGKRMTDSLQHGDLLCWIVLSGLFGFKQPCFKQTKGCKRHVTWTLDTILPRLDILHLLSRYKYRFADLFSCVCGSQEQNKK